MYTRDQPPYGYRNAKLKANSYICNLYVHTWVHIIF